MCPLLCRESEAKGRALLQRVSAPVTRVSSECKEIVRVRDSKPTLPRKSASVVLVPLCGLHPRSSRTAAPTLPPRLSMPPSTAPRSSVPVTRKDVSRTKLPSAGRSSDSLEHIRDRLCRENIRLSAELEKTKSELNRALLRIKELEKELKQRNRSSFSSHKWHVC